MGTKEDYIETVLTCEGDFYDPEFHEHLDEFSQRLKSLLSPGAEHLVLMKVEPWNSVKITFNIPREAAVRLKQLAEQGDHTLRELGILSVQIEGDRSISLTIAGKNNETTELVFRTTGPPNAVVGGPAAASAAASAALPPSLGATGVFDVSSSDELALPGPSNVEATRKNIARYLGQGPNVLQDIFGPQAPGHDGEFKVPSSMGMEGIPSMPSPAPHRSPGHQPSLPSPQPMGQHIRPPPSYSNAAVAAPSFQPHQGLFTGPGPQQGQLSPASPKYPTPPPSVSNPNSPGMRAGATPINMQAMQHAAFQQQQHQQHQQQQPHAGQHGPHVNPIMNNMARIMGHKDITSSSPLLVNLLQNDANAMGHLNNLAQHGKLQFPFDAGGQPPAKRRRKPRKPKDGKASKTGAGADPALQMDIASTIPQQDRVPVSGEPVGPGQFMRANSVTPPSSASAALPGQPVFSKSPDGKVRQIINPITGQLEVVDDDNSNSSAARSESTASGVSLDTGPPLSQLQPPPNPLVALQQSNLFPKHSSVQASTNSSLHPPTSLSALTCPSMSPAGSQEMQSPRDQQQQPKFHHPQQPLVHPQMTPQQLQLAISSGAQHQAPPGVMRAVSSSGAFAPQLVGNSTSSSVGLPHQSVAPGISSNPPSFASVASSSAASLPSAVTNAGNTQISTSMATAIHPQIPHPQLLPNPQVATGVAGSMNVNASHPVPSQPPPHLDTPRPGLVSSQVGMPPHIAAGSTRHHVPPAQVASQFSNTAATNPAAHARAAVPTSSSLSLLGQMVHSQFPVPVPSRPMLSQGAACSTAPSSVGGSVLQHPPQALQPPHPIQQQPPPPSSSSTCHTSSSVPSPFHPQHQPPSVNVPSAENQPLPLTDTPPSSADTASNASVSDQSPSSQISPNLLPQSSAKAAHPLSGVAPSHHQAEHSTVNEDTNAPTVEKDSVTHVGESVIQTDTTTDTKGLSEERKDTVGTTGPPPPNSPSISAELSKEPGAVTEEQSVGSKHIEGESTSSVITKQGDEEAMDTEAMQRASPSVSPTSTLSSLPNHSPEVSLSPDHKDNLNEAQDSEGKESPSKDGSDMASKESPSYASSGNTNGPTSMDSADSGVSMGTNMSDKKDTPPNGGLEGYDNDLVDQAGPVPTMALSQENSYECTEINEDSTKLKSESISPSKLPMQNSLNHDSDLSNHIGDDFECDELNRVTENHKGSVSPNEASQDSKQMPNIANENGPKPLKNVITVGYAMSNEQQPDRLLDTDISSKVINSALTKKSEKQDVPFLVRPFKLSGEETEQGLNPKISSIQQSLNWMGKSDLNPGGIVGDRGKDLKSLQLGPKSSVSPVNGDDTSSDLKLWVGEKIHSQNNNKLETSVVEEKSLQKDSVVTSEDAESESCAPNAITPEKAEEPHQEEVMKDEANEKDVEKPVVEEHEAKQDVTPEETPDQTAPPTVQPLPYHDHQQESEQKSSEAAPTALPVETSDEAEQQKEEQSNVPEVEVVESVHAKEEPASSENCPDATSQEEAAVDPVPADVVMQETSSSTADPPAEPPATAQAVTIEASAEQEVSNVKVDIKQVASAAAKQTVLTDVSALSEEKVESQKEQDEIPMDVEEADDKPRIFLPPSNPIPASDLSLFPSIVPSQPPDDLFESDSQESLSQTEDEVTTPTTVTTPSKVEEPRNIFSALSSVLETPKDQACTIHLTDSDLKASASSRSPSETITSGAVTDNPVKETPNPILSQKEHVVDNKDDQAKMGKKQNVSPTLSLNKFKNSKTFSLDKILPGLSKQDSLEKKDNVDQAESSRKAETVEFPTADGKPEISASGQVDLQPSKTALTHTQESQKLQTDSQKSEEDSGILPSTQSAVSTSAVTSAPSIVQTARVEVKESTPMDQSVNVIISKSAPIVSATAASISLSTTVTPSTESEASISSSQSIANSQLGSSENPTISTTAVSSASHAVTTTSSSISPKTQKMSPKIQVLPGATPSSSSSAQSSSRSSSPRASSTSPGSLSPGVHPAVGPMMMQQMQQASLQAAAFMNHQLAMYNAGQLQSEYFRKAQAYNMMVAQTYAQSLAQVTRLNSTTPGDAKTKLVTSSTQQSAKATTALHVDTSHSSHKSKSSPGSARSSPGSSKASPGKCSPGSSRGTVVPVTEKQPKRKSPHHQKLPSPQTAAPASVSTAVTAASPVPAATVTQMSLTDPLLADKKNLKVETLTSSSPVVVVTTEVSSIVVSATSAGTVTSNVSLSTKTVPVVLKTVPSTSDTSKASEFQSEKIEVKSVKQAMNKAGGTKGISILKPLYDKDDFFDDEYEQVTKTVVKDVTTAKIVKETSPVPEGSTVLKTSPVESINAIPPKPSSKKTQFTVAQLLDSRDAAKAKQIADTSPGGNQATTPPKPKSVTLIPVKADGVKVTTSGTQYIGLPASVAAKVLPSGALAKLSQTQGLSTTPGGIVAPTPISSAPRIIVTTTTASSQPASSSAMTPPMKAPSPVGKTSPVTTNTTKTGSTKKAATIVNTAAANAEAEQLAKNIIKAGQERERAAEMKAQFPKPSSTAGKKQASKESQNATHISNFVQKSINTPTKVNSVGHHLPLMAPGFPKHLSESVKMVMKAVPQPDGTPPPSPKHGKSPAASPVKAKVITQSGTVQSVTNSVRLPETLGELKSVLDARSVTNASKTGNSVSPITVIGRQKTPSPQPVLSAMNLSLVASANHRSADPSSSSSSPQRMSPQLNRRTPSPRQALSAQHSPRSTPSTPHISPSRTPDPLRVTPPPPQMAKTPPSLMRVSPNKLAAASTGGTNLHLSVANSLSSLVPSDMMTQSTVITLCTAGGSTLGEHSYSAKPPPAKVMSAPATTLPVQLSQDVLPPQLVQQAKEHESQEAQPAMKSARILDLSSAVEVRKPEVGSRINNLGAALLANAIASQPRIKTDTDGTVASKLSESGISMKNQVSPKKHFQKHELVGQVMPPIKTYSKTADPGKSVKAAEQTTSKRTEPTKKIAQVVKKSSTISPKSVSPKNIAHVPAKALKSTEKPNVQDAVDTKSDDSNHPSTETKITAEIGKIQAVVAKTGVISSTNDDTTVKRMELTTPLTVETNIHPHATRSAKRKASESISPQVSDNDIDAQKPAAKMAKMMLESPSDEVVKPGKVKRRNSRESTDSRTSSTKEDTSPVKLLLPTHATRSRKASECSDASSVSEERGASSRRGPKTGAASADTRADSPAPRVSARISARSSRKRASEDPSPSSEDLSQPRGRSRPKRKPTPPGEPTAPKGEGVLAVPVPENSEEKSQKPPAPSPVGEGSKSKKSANGASSKVDEGKVLNNKVSKPATKSKAQTKADGSQGNVTEGSSVTAAPASTSTTTTAADPMQATRRSTRMRQIKDHGDMIPIPAIKRRR